MIKINGEFGKIKLDHLAWLVTTILFTSFFMLMKENYGRYIYTGLSLIMIFIMAVFIFILIICVNIPFFSGYFERFIEFIESMLGFRQKDASAVIRGGMIDIGFEQFLKTPVLGIGGGNSVLVSAKQNGIEVYLHNNYIDQLVNIGMAGTCVYYFYYIIPFRRLYQNRTDTTSRLCFSFLLVTLILDYGMVSSTSRETFFYLMIFATVYKGIHIKKQNNGLPTY